MEVSMLTTEQAARIVGGVCRGQSVAFTRVVTDSRTVQAGDLFVALRGEHFDGNAFSAGALCAGAAAVMVDVSCATDIAPAVVVADTRLALGQLAADWRQRMPAKLAAITGSSGKTSVKDMLAAIVRAAVGDAALCVTPGNLNNDIGMPLTLLGLRPQHQYAVIEMGMNHAGELDYLSHLARPDWVLINNAGQAHVGLLGSVAAVAQAKGEIIAGCAPTSTVALNADDIYCAMWRELAGARQVLTFGLAQSADVRGRYVATEDGCRLRIMFAGDEIEVSLPVPGRHNAMNALAAATLAAAMGMSLAAIQTGLQTFVSAPGRLQIRILPNGTRLIDDSYNANPESVHAAIDVLAGYAGRRVLVLGDMGELGNASEAAHTGVGEYAKSRGIDTLMAMGHDSQLAIRVFGVGGQHFDDIVDLVDALRPQLTAEATVLIKGSRFMRMERVVEMLEGSA